MNQKAIKSYRKGEPCMRVTHLPNFFLKMKGKHDVSKREASAHVFINGLYDKCLDIEAYEVAKAEQLLKDYREEGIVHHRKINHYIFYEIGSSNMDSSEKQKKHRECRASIERINTIREIVEGINAALERRISEMRIHCSRKIDAYTQGVKLVIPDFYPVTYYYEKSVDEYLSEHKYTDIKFTRIIKPPLI